MIKTTKNFEQKFLEKENKERSDFLRPNPHSISICIEDGKFKHINISDNVIGGSYYARDIRAISELITCLTLAQEFLNNESVTENLN